MIKNSKFVALAIVLGLVLTAAIAYAQKAGTFRGQVTNVKIVECNLIPGSCRGTVTLKTTDGKTVTANIEPKSVITRGLNRVHIGDLGVGNFIEVRGIMPKEDAPEINVWDIIFWNG